MPSTRRAAGLTSEQVTSMIEAIEVMDHRIMQRRGPCPDCGGTGRGGSNTTDGGADDDCVTCSGEGS